MSEQIPRDIVLWSNRLDDRLRAILKRHRQGPEPVPHRDTMEMLMLERRREQKLENASMRQIYQALADNPTPSIDSDLLERCEKLRKTQEANHAG